MAEILNPDEEFVRNLKKRIKSNGGYCLNKEKNTKDNKCPCQADLGTGQGRNNLGCRLGSLYTG